MASGYVYPVFSGSYGVTFGAPAAGGAGGTVITAGGNFAVVLTEHGDDQAPIRFTTWGLAAQTALAYQSRAAGSVIYLGNSGYIYRLDPTVFTDDGSAIPVTYTTGILPWIDDQLRPKDVEAEKILVGVSWTLKTVPGSVSVTVTAIDADDATHTVSRMITQTTKQVSVRFGLRARRWIIVWETSSPGNFNIVEFAQEIILKATLRVGDQ
jgi:hypothetical protein